jgi:hypothetical protein
MQMIKIFGGGPDHPEDAHVRYQPKSSTFTIIFPNLQKSNQTPNHIDNPAITSTTIQKPKLSQTSACTYSIKSSHKGNCIFLLFMLHELLLEIKYYIEKKSMKINNVRSM